MADSGTLATLDFGMIFISWTDNTVKHGWLFVIPAGNEVTAPELPAALSDWIPAVPAGEYRVDLLWLAETIDNVPYSEIRAHFGEYAKKLRHVTTLD